jgi:hypothetical protein
MFGVYDIINWFRDPVCWWILYESSAERYIGVELVQEGQTVLPRLACLSSAICRILSLNLHTLLNCYFYFAVAITSLNTWADSTPVPRAYH